MADILPAETTVGVSELKRSQMSAIAAGDGFPVAILNRNEPAFKALRGRLRAVVVLVVAVRRCDRNAVHRREHGPIATGTTARRCTGSSRQQSDMSRCRRVWV